jgi:hypothetical protein
MERRWRRWREVVAEARCRRVRHSSRAAATSDGKLMGAVVAEPGIELELGFVGGGGGE